MTARSFLSSRATSSAFAEVPDMDLTVICAQSFTTWALVRISPSALTTTPEPDIADALLAGAGLTRGLATATARIARIAIRFETGTRRIVMEACFFDFRAKSKPSRSVQFNAQ
jgi:hypothetical protein